MSLDIQRLRRVTSSGNWIPAIDGLRFIAIFSVLLFHMSLELSKSSGRMIPIEPGYWWLARLLGNGYRGVEIFFVISGMILALPFARHFLSNSKPVSLRKYYMRRLTRLEPPYIASIVVAALMICVFNRRVPGWLWLHTLVSLLYQHSAVFGSMSSVNPVLWSLEVEIQFYILAPLLMQCFRIRSTVLRRVLLAAAIILLPMAEMPFVHDPRFEGSILFYLQYFATGLLMADIFVLDIPRLRISWLWDVAGWAALAAVFWMPSDSYWPHAVLPLPIAIVFVAAMCSVGLRSFLNQRWIAVTGGMCYSIYLLHFLFIAMMFKLTRHAIVPGALFIVNFGIQLVITLVPVLALCTAFYVLVERPCMDPDWPGKLWRALNDRSASFETSNPDQAS